MEYHLAVVLIEIAGWGKEREDEGRKKLQKLFSILFYALLIDEKNVNIMIHFIGFKIWKQFNGYKMVIHSFMLHIFYWVPMYNHLLH